MHPVNDVSNVDLRSAASNPEHSPAVPNLPEDNEFDAFLTHDWRLDADGRDNHQRVCRIAEGLKAHGIKVWLDEHQMQDDINIAMCRGIERSRVVVMFVTKVYCNKVDGDNAQDNCKGEFTYIQQLRKPVIPVPMERGMLNTQAWTGPVGMRYGTQLYVAQFTEDAIQTDEVGKLAAKIKDKIKATKGTASTR